MPRLIVTAGRFDHRADLTTALWAFDTVRYTAPDLRLIVTGDGPHRERLHRHVRAARHDEPLVTFATVSPEQFAAAAQVWIPHRSGGERLALAAMAAGVPVVAADTPELGAALGDAALFFPPGDHAQLATRAYRLLTHPDEATALGVSGRRRGSEQFPPWQLADALAAVYHEAGALPAS